MNYYQRSALAPTTINTYTSGVNGYLSFCNELSITPFPLNENYLQLYVSQIARRVSFRTIKVYLAGLQFTSTMLGHTETISGMHRLFYTIRGIRRTQGDNHRPRRQPFTIQHIQHLFTFLDLSQLHDIDKLLLRSATTLAFFGLLRCSEYTSNSRHWFDASCTLLLTDTRFSNSFDIAIINLKSSKTDPFKSGCTIRVGSIGSNICPVKALRQFLRNCLHRSGPLYTFVNGTYLTRTYLSNLITGLWPSSTLNTHSFRIGGASSAAAAGIPDSTIQLLGRWSSNAYQRYIHITDDNVIDSAIRMSSALNLDRIWDPDTMSSRSFNI